VIACGCHLPNPRRGLSSAAFTLKGLEQVLSSDEVIVEDAPRDVQQLTNEWIDHGVSHAHSDLASGDHIVRAQHGELLRHDRLADLQRVLKFLDGSILTNQQLENLNTNGMRQSLEKCCLERLQFMTCRPLGVLHT
jgi:hypothetical protein